MSLLSSNHNQEMRKIELPNFSSFKTNISKILKKNNYVNLMRIKNN